MDVKQIQRNRMKKGAVGKGWGGGGGGGTRKNRDIEKRDLSFA